MRRQRIGGNLILAALSFTLECAPDAPISGARRHSGIPHLTTSPAAITRSTDARQMAANNGEAK